MIRYITLAVLALFLVTPAQAATKAQVLAHGCQTQETARKQNLNDHLHYRLIGGKQCWYSEVALVGKPKVLAAVKKVTSPVYHQPTDVELEEFLTFLCGGPCPQLKGEMRQQWPPEVPHGDD